MLFDGGHFFILWEFKRDLREISIPRDFNSQRFKRDFNSKNSRDFAHAVAEFGI